MFARTFEIILYPKLQKLIGRKSYARMGLGIYGISVIFVSLKKGGRLPIEMNTLTVVTMSGMTTFHFCWNKDPEKSIRSRCPIPYPPTLKSRLANLHVRDFSHQFLSISSKFCQRMHSNIPSSFNMASPSLYSICIVLDRKIVYLLLFLFLSLSINPPYLRILKYCFSFLLQELFDERISNYCCHEWVISLSIFVSRRSLHTSTACEVLISIPSPPLIPISSVWVYRFLATFSSPCPFRPYYCWTSYCSW